MQEIKDKIISQCEIYNKDAGPDNFSGDLMEKFDAYEAYKTQDLINIKDNEDTYVFDQNAKDILENYGIYTYLNNQFE